MYVIKNKSCFIRHNSFVTRKCKGGGSQYVCGVSPNESYFVSVKTCKASFRNVKE